MTVGRRLRIAIAACLVVVGCAPTTSPLAETSPDGAAGSRSTSVATTQAPAPIPHRIAVRDVDGVSELFDIRSGDPFVPRGANLIRLAEGGHSTLDVGRYDAAATEEVFGRMVEAGYNTVRVFINANRGGGIPGSGRPLSDDYLDNVADLLDRAATHDLQVMLTTDWLPDSAAYGFDSDPLIENVNAMYLSSGGVEANARFFGDFARALVERGARLDSLLAYELRNELYFTNLYPPFSLSSGMVTTANGQTYDLAAAGDHVRMLEENLVPWVDTMRLAIVEIRRRWSRSASSSQKDRTRPEWATIAKSKRGR